MGGTSFIGVNEAVAVAVIEKELTPKRRPKVVPREPLAVVSRRTVTRHDFWLAKLGLKEINQYKQGHRYYKEALLQGKSFLLDRRHQFLMGILSAQPEQIRGGVPGSFGGTSLRGVNAAVAVAVKEKELTPRSRPKVVPRGVRTVTRTAFGRAVPIPPTVNSLAPIVGRGVLVA